MSSEIADPTQKLFNVVKDSHIMPEKIYSLLNEGANVNAVNKHGQSILMRTAACNANPEIIRMLITAGADGLDSALDTAIDCGNCEAARVLLRYGADAEYSDTETAKTRLMCAAEHHSSPEMIELLIEAGADVNETDLSERTPLMFAASNDKYVYDSKVIKTLLSHGADVKYRDFYGRTALHYACKNPDEKKTIAMLIKAGADINAKDDYGCTPLMFACGRYYSSAEAVKVLLRAGADVNAQDNDGWTALFWAAANRELRGDEAAEIVDMLIFAGADVHIQDESEYGKTALDVAESEKVYNILREVM